MKKPTNALAIIYVLYYTHQHVSVALCVYSIMFEV
jgi:hypothetical protein